MTRIDDFWPRMAVMSTALLYWLTVLIYVLVGLRGKWIWLLYGSIIALVASVLYLLAATVLNPWRRFRAIDGEDA
jgi:hypothetical protein